MHRGLFQRNGGGITQTADGCERQTHFAVLNHVLTGVASAQLDGQKLAAALQHFVFQLQADQRVIVLGGALVLGDLFVVAQVLLRHTDAAHGGLIVNIRAAHREVHRVEDGRVVDLEPHQADGRHQVGHGVGLGEHILDLAAGFNIPVGHIVLAHGLLPPGLEAALGDLALTHGLHDVERHLRLQSLAQQVQHDAVTAADDLRNRAGTRADQLVGVAGPDVGAVGQAGDLDQLGEILRLGIQKHLAHEVCAHFGDAERAGLGADLFLRHAEGLGAGQQTVDLLVVHRDGINRNAGVFLKELVEGRHIMAQLIQLEQRIVQVFKFKVGRQQTALDVVRRVLDGAEVVNVEGIRHNDHAAGVLTRRALDAGAAHDKAVFLGAVDGLAALLEVFFDVAVSGLILQTGDRARLEHVFLAEQLLGVAVDVGLIHAREVQVNIRLLVAVEAEEGLKRDVVALDDHRLAADRASLVGQVEAVKVYAVVDPLAVLAVGAQIVRRHRVDLGNAGEVRDGG